MCAVGALGPLETLILDNNPGLVGLVGKGHGELRKGDAHLDSWQLFCTALGKTQVESFHCKNIGMGAKAAAMLAEIVTDGHDFARRLEKLAMLENRIGDGGRTAFARALFVEGQTTKATALRNLCVDLEQAGPLELTTNEKSALELSDMDMRPKDTLLIAAWGKTRWKALKRLDVSRNPNIFKRRVERHSDSDVSDADEDDEDRSSEEGGDFMTRRFRIAVLQCRSLAKADLSGYNDPFVSLQVDHLEEVRTATIDQGGVAPVWGGGGGETLLFDELTAPPAMVEVKVWDEDPGGHSADDLIGSHQLDLDGELKIAPDHDWSHTAWLPLVNQKGKPAGEVPMALRWDATELIDGSLPPPEC